MNLKAHQWKVFQNEAMKRKKKRLEKLTQHQRPVRQISNSLQCEIEVTEGGRKIIEKIMAANCSNLMKSLNPLI